MRLSTTTRTFRRWMAVAAAMTLVLGACGGDDSDGSVLEPIGGADDRGSVGSDDGSDDGSSDAASAGGPVTGPLVSVLSFDFGLWTIDPDTGAARALPIDGLGYSDRQNPAMVSSDGTTAYLIAYTLVDGQSFTNEVSLAAIDLATGAGRVVAPLGQDREDDESTELTTSTLVGATADTVWVERSVFGTSSRVLVGIDAATGAETARIEPGPDVDVRSPVLVGDTLYAVVGGVISRGAGAGWEPVADLNDLGLDQVLTAATINDFAITRSGAPIDDEWAEFIIGFGEPRPTNGWVAAEGSLWWVFGSIESREDETAIVGGIVQFDPVSGTLVQAWPLGDRVGEFLDENSVTTATQGSYAALDGAVWFADARDSGALFKLEPATGVTAFDIPVRDGIDYARIVLITSDPDALWVEVEEWVVTSDDADGRSATGTTNIERFDPVTGSSVLVVPELDLTGF